MDTATLVRPTQIATALSESEQIAVPATWMRGGTSNALFFLEKDLPPPGPLRDKLIKRAMGCPQETQIDGMGGARPSTSKVAIIGISERDDADIFYTFAQVGIEEDFIDYRAACGNISSAVGPFALMKGLVRAEEPITSIRIYHTNIDDLLFQTVPTRGGEPRVSGDYVTAGVPGTGAEILTDFHRSVGKRTGALLPSGKVRDQIKLSDGRVIDATLIDAGNPAAFVSAAQLGVVGNELPPVIMANAELMNAIREIRVAAAKLMGMEGKFVARLGLMSSPSTYAGSQAGTVTADSIDLCGRFFELAHCGPSYPGTASVSTGAAARIPGSVVYDLLPQAAHHREIIRIGHPMGVMEVHAVGRAAPVLGGVKLEKLAFGRTARALMEGVVFVPREEMQG